MMASRTKPLLRGWSHAVAAFVAAGFGAVLAARVADNPGRLASILVYAVCMVAMFAASAVYHVGEWSPRWSRILRSLDHGGIFLMIAGTTTAIGGSVLEGTARTVMLAMVWLLAGTGLVLAIWTARLSRWVRVSLYAIAGVSGLIGTPALLARLPVEALATMASGGLLYGVGAVIYARRQPDPVPHIFGFHELFHLFVIAGCAAFAAMIWRWIATL